VRQANLHYTAEFLKHKTGRHFECPERLSACIESLRSSGGLGALRAGAVRPATREEIQKVHDAALVDSLEAMSRAGGGMQDSDTVVSAGSFDAALLAAGVAIEAAGAVVSGEAEQALALVRPPGHHATRAQGMGFCLFNNVAIAARHLFESAGLGRVAILDFDVHHGNGTQEAFYEDPRVMFVSFHRSPFYPGTGRREETGAGAGEGYTVNIPLPYNTSAAKYHSLWDEVLREKVLPFGPEAILVSAGFDNYKYDPVGGLNFEVDDFRILGESILMLADAACGGRIASVLEGGYDLDALPRSLEAYLEGLQALPPKGAE
jgi:acetoin utilization deacetylase AcuC-like enzyme